MNNLQNTYNWLNGIFCEPTTAITDFMLAFFCLWCCKAILSSARKKEFKVMWAVFFFCVGGSTFFGGLAHSVSCLENIAYYKCAWIFMQLFSGASVYFAQRAVFSTEAKSEKSKEQLNNIALYQFGAFWVCVIVFMSFKVVAINSLIGLIQLIVICFPINANKWIYKTSITLGLLISFLTVYINHTKLSLAYWFNYNDISHIIIFTSLFLIYKGIKYKPNLKNFLKTI